MSDLVKVKEALEGFLGEESPTYISPYRHTHGGKQIIRENERYIKLKQSISFLESAIAEQDRLREALRSIREYALKREPGELDHSAERIVTRLKSIHNKYWKGRT